MQGSAEIVSAQHDELSWHEHHHQDQEQYITSTPEESHAPL